MDIWDFLLAFAVATVCITLLVRRYNRPAITRSNGRGLDGPNPDVLDAPFRRAEANLKAHPPKEAAFHARPRSFGTRATPPIVPGRITLTPRQLERVNIQRRLQNRAPLNYAGFSNAVAHAWDQPRRQPDNTQNWLTYLILYEVFLADHQSNRVSCDSGITISPDQPYNGQGGAFGGAGASGNWTSSDNATAAAAAAAIAAGVSVDPTIFRTPMVDQGEKEARVDPLSDLGSYKGSSDYESRPSGLEERPTAPDPTPNYSAPDPTPSYSAPSSDSSSSYSSDSSSSSSSDGGSSGGGGGGD